MQAFSYVPVNGHGVADIDGRKFLVEPGLPFSMAERPIHIDGREIDVQDEVFGLRVADLSPRVGIQLDGVLGANASGDFVVNLLPDQRSIVFDQYLSDFPINIQVDNLGGVASLHLGIAGKRSRGLLDLGCGLSLVHPKLVEGLEPESRECEVFGYIGRRDIDIYSLPVMLERRPVHLRFGVLPEELLCWLEAANVEAIIGHELLQHYAVSLAIEEGSVSLDPLH